MTYFTCKNIRNGSCITLLLFLIFQDDKIYSQHNLYVYLYFYTGIIILARVELLMSTTRGRVYKLFVAAGSTTLPARPSYFLLNDFEPAPLPNNKELVLFGGHLQLAIFAAHKS